MTELKVPGLEPKTVENASPAAREIMLKTKKALGFIPNMYSGMAGNPALLDAYTYAYSTFRAQAGFSPQEQEVIFLSVAYENSCEYCVAAHSFIADSMSKVPKEVTDAIRNNTVIPDKKLNALSRFTKVMTATRGLPGQEEIERFLAAGYKPEDILGVITGIGVKTFSNYFNHMNNTAVDKVFAGRIWKKA